MPQAIKSFAVNTTAAGTVTVYSCPANTTAKVLIPYLVISSTGDNINSKSATLNIGFVSYSTSEISASSSTATIQSLNSSTAASASTTTTLAATNSMLEYYLAAGQTISTVISSTGSSIKAQILVIEEAS